MVSNLSKLEVIHLIKAYIVLLPIKETKSRLKYKEMAFEEIRRTFPFRSSQKETLFSLTMVFIGLRE